MEKASGSDLSAFFEAWIYGTDIPQLQVRHTVQGSTATVTVEQRGEVIPVPVTHHARVHEREHRTPDDSRDGAQCHAHAPLDRDVTGARREPGGFVAVFDR